MKRAKKFQAEILLKIKIVFSWWSVGKSLHFEQQFWMYLELVKKIPKIEIGFIFWFFFFKILLDRSILYFVYIDKLSTLLMESRCFLRKPLPRSHSRFPSQNFDGSFKPLMLLGFVPWADTAPRFQHLKVRQEWEAMPFPTFTGCLEWWCGEESRGLWLSCIAVIYLTLFVFPGVSLAIYSFIYLLVPWWCLEPELGGDTPVQGSEGWQKQTSCPAKDWKEQIFPLSRGGILRLL